MRTTTTTTPPTNIAISSAEFEEDTVELDVVIEVNVDVLVLIVCDVLDPVKTSCSGIISMTWDEKCGIATRI